MRMGSHPANLIFRFLLEATALVALGVWGWSQGTGVLRYVYALLAPLAGAFLYSTFGVPGDPTRTGSVPVAIPGLLRISLEIGFFGFAVWGLAEANEITLAWIYGLMIVVHYALSLDRLGWLIHRGQPGAHEQHPRRKAG